MKKTTSESIKYPVSFSGDVQHARRIAIDIGGSLAKLVYLVEIENSQTSEQDNKVSDDKTSSSSYQMRFVSFETKYIETCLDYIQKLYMNKEKPLTSGLIFATGGGSVKYQDLIMNKLGLQLQKEDEIDCIIKGSIFLVKHIKNECFEFDKDHFPSLAYQKLADNSSFPFLLANVGSGVSFIKVESDDKYERVGGTALGGGTFWGLGSLLTDSSCFSDLINMASEGRSENVDMLVDDIYGGDYEFLNLPKELIASFFGKCFRSLNDKFKIKSGQFNHSDISKSVLKMICYNIGHLAVLYAKIHNLNRIYFGGHFIRNNYLIILTISEAVAYISQKSISAIFFKHDGFIGAVGAFQNGLLREKSDPLIAKKISLDQSAFPCFEENIAASSCENYSVIHTHNPIKVLSFNMNCETNQFPLLEKYGDNLVDRELILEYVENIIEWVPLFLNEFKKHHDTNLDCCENFSKRIKIRLECYKSGDPLNITNYLNDILNIQDHFIKQYLLLDPFLKFKYEQNQNALSLLSDLQQHLSKLDTIQRHESIFRHIFAGNLIDFSSPDILKLNPSSLDLKQCLHMIDKKNTCFINGDIETWMTRFKSGKWKKVLIFVNNSGVDIVLGISNLIEEFVKNGSKVILAANTYPSFYDIVYSELPLLFERLKCINPILKKYENMISFVDTGFGSCYLNLPSTNLALCNISSDVDLIIVEGISRSLVGFSGAEFKCDTLYMGTVTSSTFAKRFHMDLYDTFMKFDFKN